MHKAEEASAISSLMRAIERAWNRRDVKSYARLYAVDARYVTRAGTLWLGRKAIEKGHAAAFRGELKGTALKIEVKRVLFTGEGEAVARCAIDLSDGARGGASKIRGVTTFVLRKNRGRWEIVSARTREILARRK
jgi:uncharacterized protein (TIGR02246 family)